LSHRRVRSRRRWYRACEIEMRWRYERWRGGNQRTKHEQPFIQTRPAFRTNPADAAFRPFGFYLYNEGNPSAYPFLSSGVVANNYNHPVAASVWYQRWLSERKTGSPRVGTWYVLDCHSTPSLRVSGTSDGYPKGKQAPPGSELGMFLTVILPRRCECLVPAMVIRKENRLPPGRNLVCS
jgi:hypothetical protein